jgi:glycosyltransferase involved in cell wall biosynthesis/2-polyprenyl-3-methyl-5-hydroxy-6-metoxy-1,4-benzoquinol methylase
MHPCWCGNTDLPSFGPEYGECRACGTLVSQQGLSSAELQVNDDEHDFYGKQYWLDHQKQDLSFPDIHARARNDLTERNLHWLKALLKYRLPPAEVLELGCAHGSFVALMQQTGFQASGTEMSPWVVDFGKKTFGITVHLGPVESLDAPPASLDVIALMDVLEHLPDPLATMRRCLELLKPEGLLLIQTPRFKEGISHEALVESKSAFLEQLKSDEHLYLFSERSVTDLFRRLGTEYIHFEPAIFAHYDMFFAVGRTPLQINAPEQIEAKLLATPSGRQVLALLDLRERELALTERLKESETDRAARGGQIETLTAMVWESEADRAARGKQIETLTAMLRESEADRAARGEQIETLTAMLRESDADRAARDGQIETLTAMLRESDADRATRDGQIKTLTAMLRESDADRAARGGQIETLTAMLRESDADRAARGGRIKALMAMLRESNADRAARGEQIATLTADLHTLFSRSGFRGLTKFAHWPELKKLRERLVIPNGKAPGTIAVDLTPVLPGGENGGAKIFVLELLRRLAEMEPQTRFVLLTQAASHEELAALECRNMRRLLVIGSTATNALPELGDSGALLHDIGADLLFCPFTAPTYYEVGIPTVCTIHDLQYKTYPEFFTAEDVAHRDRIFVNAHRRATALAAVSEYSRNTAITHGNLDPVRIRTIHHRLAFRILPETEHDIRVLNRLDLTPQRYLIYPANFWKHKNHEMLLAAFGMACHQGLPADIKLVCTGAPGARQEWLISAARTMNLGDRVLFPGYVPNAELAALMAHSSGMVFPSLYEGFGLPIIEAMAAGVPVACSSTTSLPEVAADAAILFDPRVPTQIAEAMVSLVYDDVLRTRLIQAGRQRAAEFSDSERMAREYWELFQYALANEKCEDLLTGVHADGWAGPCLRIQIAPADHAQTLELELFAPEWLPQPGITVQASSRGKPQGIPLEIARGTHSVWSMPVEAAGGSYSLEISPTFVPARLGSGEDERELSAIVQRCGIVRAGEDSIELFPGKVSA